LIDLCSSPPFKIALVPPRKVEKVILARVVWLELLRTDHVVTEEGKPRNQMSHENEMIGRPAQYFAGLPRSKLVEESRTSDIKAAISTIRSSQPNVRSPTVKDEATAVDNSHRKRNLKPHEP
jgi:hypothetical protein